MTVKPLRRSALRVLALQILMMTGIFAWSCQKEVYQFGAVLPLTGEYSPYGEAIKRGVELAVADLQADPGFTTKVVLTVADSQSDPKKAKELLDNLYSDGALAAVGGATSGEAMEMISVVDRYDRVLLSPSASSPKLSGISRNFYRVCPSDARDGVKMATFAMEQLKLAKVVILAEDETYAQGIQEVFHQEFERLGGKVLEDIEFPPNTSDFSGLVQRVITLQPDAVYLAAYGDGIAAMISELRKAAFAGRILTTHAFATPTLITQVGDAARGVFLTRTVFEPDSDHAIVKKFVTTYQQKHGQAPDIFAAQGYDAMLILANAIKGRSPLASEVPKGMREEFSGVTGSIRFDDKGDAQKYPRIYTIGDNLALYDYDSMAAKWEEEIKRKKKELEDRLKQLREEMKSGGA